MARTHENLKDLRVCFIAPRYDERIVGGSESYLRVLCEGLAARGAAIEVVTTTSLGVEFRSRYAIRWPSGPAVTSHRNGITVRRCAPLSLPRWAVRRLEATLESALDRAAASHPLPSEESHLVGGFFALERWAEGQSIRWTRRDAAIAVRQPDARAVQIRLYALRPTTVLLDVDGRRSTTKDLPAAAWTDIELSLDGAAPCVVRWRTQRCVRPPGDARTLGVAVATIDIVGASSVTNLPLTRDEESLFTSLSTATIFAPLDARAAALSARAGLADSLLKGPVGVRLLWNALRAARRADVIVATNAPYATLALGGLVARLARRPFLTLPFLHPRDPFHHRPQVRGPLAAASGVLCLSKTERALLDPRIDGRSYLLGGGVDLAELSQLSISGQRFRERHRLGSDALVLQVCRKTLRKGYRTGALAVSRLAQRGVPVKFLLVGPDEDGEPLDEPCTLYLGKLERAELLDALDACDVFCLPSLDESFGLVYLEAWMRAKPVIGHALCDAARDLIEPGEDGELVSDLESLTAALERLLRDRDYRTALGENGRCKVRRSHDWQRVLARAANAMVEVSK